MREWIRPDQDVSKSQLDAAGALLIGRQPKGKAPDNRDAALAIINRWRSAHNWPLNTVMTTLRRRSEAVSQHALVAQRLKRLSSIDAKLRRFPAMQLSQMQDIGGCRAVLPTVAAVNEMVQQYHEARAKSPKRGVQILKVYDYIGTPKPDGYRGIHLIFRYGSRSAKNADWNGMRVEMQVRTALQHAWATAVETVSTFTGQQLKADVGEDSWKRFFALMSSAIALRENCPQVAATPTNPRELVTELRLLNDSLNVDTVLSAYQTVVHHSGTSDVPRGGYYLVILDTESRQVTVSGFEDAEQAKASAAYLEIEKRVEENPNLNAVLASVDTIASLRVAFPNYYLDTTVFRAALADALRV